MVRKLSLGAAAAVATCALVGLASFASCSTTPVNVPVRTFEQPQKVDVVCMQVYNTDGSRVSPPVPVAQSNCAPVPSGDIGEGLPYHLYALVTQRTRGELAVVDLTGGYVVDIDHSTPGINFIPVGAQPTDVAVAPDALMTFVTAAEPNKPALYAVANKLILGDSQQAGWTFIPTLTSLPACSLPQAPIAVTVVQRGAAPTADAGANADGGADGGDGGDDGGVPPPAPATYELLVLLAGTGGQTAKLVSVDPAPLLRGAKLLPPDPDPTKTIAPGSLKPCQFSKTSDNVAVALDLASTTTPPAGEAPGAWPDGIPYVDGGVSLTGLEPPPPANCPQPAMPGDGGVVEAGAPDAGSSDAGTQGASVTGVPRPLTVAYDDQRHVLYIGDSALPLIHAIDVSQPGVLRELPPLIATSADDPARVVTVGTLSISPPTRDLKRYLYALDQKAGSIMVFDITAPPSAPRPPMRRPHPELNPFQPSDRIAFGSPVAAVAFVRHDWPIAAVNNTALTATKAGLLCNPNPNIDPTQLDAGSSDLELGALYGNNSANQPLALGPYRLRGIFALATLTNGSVVALDVDDWDAPCRRPDPLDDDSVINDVNNAAMTDRVSDLAIAEPAPADVNDFDPYHAPKAYAQRPNDMSKPASTPATIEAVFPVSAPNRMRSNYLLRNDPTTGNHAPNLVGQPQLFSSQAQLATSGQSAVANPAIRPTYSRFSEPDLWADPTNVDPKQRGWALPATEPFKPYDYRFSIVSGGYPGVRLAFEVPDVHIDQDWTVTYEGVIPGFDGLAATIKNTDDSWETLTLSLPNALFCGRGIEDWDVAKGRVAQELPEMDKFGLPRPAAMSEWTGDYVQLADDIVDVSDPYWSDDSCWAFDDSLKSAPAQARHDACQSTYGSLSDTTPSVYRDFPVLEASDDKLVVGRFGYVDPNSQTPTTRQIVGKDPSNVQSMHLAYCCFHHQATFKVRAGGQWVAVGSVSGFLHHMTKDPATSRCIQSCDPRTALLNARAPEIPQPYDPKTKTTKDPTAAPDRNSPLAMRNPFFAYLMWAGAPPVAGMDGVAPRTSTVRDYVWRFSTRGQMTPLSIPLAAGIPQVDPQSMRFIESLGQLAIVDGASEGLVLIDLNTVTTAHAPYF